MSDSPYPVISEDTDPGQFGRGYTGRDLQSYPLNCLKCSQNVQLPGRIKLAEMEELIAYKDAQKSWITDQCDRVGSHVKNQMQTLLCWINAPTRGEEIFYVLERGLVLDLSAAWAGSVINGGRNHGNSGILGVEFLAEHGQPTTKYWPTNRISSAAANDQAAIANAATHKITKYGDLDPNDKEFLWSMILQDYPITVGIPSMEHEMLMTRLRWDKRAGRPRMIVDNSWGVDDGQNGRRELSGATEQFDEAGVIIDCSPATE